LVVSQGDVIATANGQNILTATFAETMQVLKTEARPLKICVLRKNVLYQPQNIRDELLALLYLYSPAKVGNTDHLIGKYRDREAELLKMIRAKYQDAWPVLSNVVVYDGHVLDSSAQQCVDCIDQEQLPWAVRLEAFFKLFNPAKLASMPQVRPLLSSRHVYPAASYIGVRCSCWQPTRDAKGGCCACSWRPRLSEK
jgi:hypothetical protein